METGKAAATWLDSHLDSDQRWADGVPADTAPWVADAFADLASLTAEELSTRATAFDDASALDVDERLATTDGDRVAAVDVRELLDGAAGFVVADDVSFEVADADLADAINGILDADADADAPDMITYVESSTSTLVDPFDSIEHSVGTEVDADRLAPTGDHDAPIPADDIVSPPVAPGSDAGDLRAVPTGPGHAEPEESSTSFETEPQAMTGSASSAVADVFDIGDSLMAAPDAVDDFRLDHVDDVDDGALATDDDDDGWTDGPAEWVDD